MPEEPFIHHAKERFPGHQFKTAWNQLVWLIAMLAYKPKLLVRPQSSFLRTHFANRTPLFERSHANKQRPRSPLDSVIEILKRAKALLPINYKELLRIRLFRQEYSRNRETKKRA